MSIAIARIHMKSTLVLVIALSIAFSVRAQDKVVVGYYPSYRHDSYPPRAIKFEHITHLAHSFIWPAASGSGAMDVPAGFVFPELIEAAHDAGVKVIVALGGAGNNAGFGPASSDPDTRAVLVQNIVEFVIDNVYDGVDLDWEGFTNAAYRDALSALIEDLDAALEAADPDLTLSMPLGATNWHGAYDMERVADHLDWIGIMTYDMHGGWTHHAGHLAPLYPAPGDEDHFSMDQSIDYWLARGVPESKLLPGIPFYGRQWEGASALHDPTVGAVTALTYASIEPLVGSEGWERHWDEVALVPYLINEDAELFLTYEDEESVAEKIEYVRERDLPGVIVWEISQDDMPTGDQPLLARVGELLEDPVDIENEQVPAVAVALGRNFPNPIASSTTIPFETGTTAHVTIEIYDVLGRRVATPSDRVFPPGAHKVTWEVADYPNGLYVCRMRAGGATHAIPMLVAR